MDEALAAVLADLRTDPRTGLELVDIPAELSRHIGELGDVLIHWVGQVEKVNSNWLSTSTRILLCTDTCLYLLNLQGLTRRCVPIRQLREAFVLSDLNDSVALAVTNEHDLFLHLKVPPAPLLTVIGRIYETMTGKALPCNCCDRSGVRKALTLTAPPQWSLEMRPMHTRVSLAKLILQQQERQQQQQQPKQPPPPPQQAHQSPPPQQQPSQPPPQQPQQPQQQPQPQQQQNGGGQQQNGGGQHTPRTARGQFPGAPPGPNPFFHHGHPHAHGPFHHQHHHHYQQQPQPTPFPHMHGYAFPQHHHQPHPQQQWMPPPPPPPPPRPPPFADPRWQPTGEQQRDEAFASYCGIREELDRVVNQRKGGGGLGGEAVVREVLQLLLPRDYLLIFSAADKYLGRSGAIDLAVRQLRGKQQSRHSLALVASHRSPEVTTLTMNVIWDLADGDAPSLTHFFTVLVTMHLRGRRWTPVCECVVVSKIPWSDPDDDPVDV